MGPTLQINVDEMAALVHFVKSGCPSFKMTKYLKNIELQKI